MSVLSEEHSQQIEGLRKLLEEAGDADDDDPFEPPV